MPEQKKTIRIKYFTDKIERLAYIDGKSDWIDLRCAEEVIMKAGEFRLIPLGVAIALPEARVTLLDSLGKRIEFLREACGALGLENTRCVHARAEEFGEREQFDWAVSRAVAPLPMLCELSLPLVRVGGRFLAMKSSHSQEELDGAGRAISILGGRVDWVKDYPIPGAEIQHRLICIEKTTPTPRKYPRRFSQLKKQPL